MSACTPSQTVGPFFHFGLCFETGAMIVSAETPGAIVIDGRVFDGAGVPVPDALLEFWQADAEGRYRGAGDRRAGTVKTDEGFDGFARVPTDATGGFRLVTLKPGAVPGPQGAAQAPHLLINMFARGLLTPQLTRLYFEDDERLLQDDPILALVPQARRGTLIARRAGEARYHWDLVLQGAHETVFFDVR
jgi:protocatechuate 3,4-dioxygenase, alpha subunit